MSNAQAMQKFVVIYRQDGGCDYTIGCGITVYHIEATDMAAAIASVVAGLSNNLSNETVDSLCRIDIYRVEGQVQLEPDAWIEAQRAARAKAARAATELKERAELERLKSKYQP